MSDPKPEARDLAERKPESQVEVLDLTRVEDAMRAFEAFKQKILTQDDYWVDRKNGNKKHVRKPGWEKYSMSLNLDTDFMDERSEAVKFNGQEVLVYHFTGYAATRSGRYAKRTGSASSDEGRPWCKTIHGIRAMAQTRAVLRAISGLVGGGELTAEEMDTKDVQGEETRRPVPSGQPRGAEDLSGGMVRTGANSVENAPKGGVLPDAQSAADLAQGDAVSGIRDVLEAAGLDPEGVEIRSLDWGFFEVVPTAAVKGEMWRKYHAALKPIGAEYHKAGSPQYAGNWTITLKNQEVPA